MKKANCYGVILGLVLLAGCVEKPAAWTDVMGHDADVPHDGEVLGGDGVGELGAGDRRQIELDATVDVETVDSGGETVCVPDCQGKECGADGCGGTCGDCGEFGACKADNTCLCEYQKCQGSCCGDGEACLNSGCCQPDCEAKQCGDDGCGGSCGECEALQACGEAGLCECLFEECAGECCPNADEICHKEACCLPDCTGKECGSDGCGGVCDECPPLYACVDEGETAFCDAKCEEFCAGLECGKAGLNDECGCGDCDDDNPCTNDVCTDEQTCELTPNVDQCDDGNPCSGPDMCDEGTCSGELLSVEELAEKQLLDQCVCALDEDCLPIEDGDFCNGILFCEKTGETGICMVDDDSIPDCSADGLFCNGIETCAQDTGSCVHVELPVLVDGIECTLDSCDEGEDETDNLGQIVHAPDDGMCLNGLWCDGGEWCDAESGCKSGEAPLVDDGVGCTVDSCDEGINQIDNLGQAVNTPDDTNCDDANSCTTDACHADDDCQFLPDDEATCDDENACTLQDACDDGLCVGGPAPDCDDDNPCTEDFCDVEQGCLNGPYVDGTACSEDPQWVCLDAQCTCVPDCTDIECGDDGCGGSCGVCGEEMVCVQGQCEWGVLECGGIACPPMGGYGTMCSEKGHCEYQNDDPTGHKKWDVWVYVPPGTFQMGCPADPEDPEKCSETGEKPSDELPQHEVTIDYGYFIGKYEVVVEQYEVCNASQPDKCSTPSTANWTGDAWGTNYWEDGTDPADGGNVFHERPDHPQNGLTWQQAKDFCGWVAPAGRLPSEAEWEYAATGPVHRKYPWGDSPEPTCSNGTAVFDQEGDQQKPWGCDPCESVGCSGTKSVGSMIAGASWFGALDMGGNVCEWCEDSYSDSHVGAPTDGSARLLQDGDLRVKRGCGFKYSSSALRTADRIPHSAVFYASLLGARCVRPAPAKSCGGVECPALDGYFVTCNKQQHCEYYNEDTTGHKKWDVWIYVAPGTFQMGCPPDPLDPEKCSETGDNPSDELPQHQVTIDYGYFIGKYEIVVEQYAACNAADPGKCTTPSTVDWNANDWGTNYWIAGEDPTDAGNTFHKRPDHPQNGLTWQQAEGFCGWVAPAGRLPSEAEWEYAATGSVHRKYPWGDSPEPTCDNDTAVLNEVGETEGYGCGQGGTWLVGSKTAGASWCGALDMSGNVWEWNEDCYQNSYSDVPTDGSAWGDPPCSRVRRGGSFYYDAALMRSAERSDFASDDRHAAHGARCVRLAE